MQNVIFHNFEEVDCRPEFQLIEKNGIVLFSLEGGKKWESYPLYSGVFLYLLVKSGEGKISIVGENHLLRPLTLIVHAPEYFSQISELSADFSADILIITKSFLDTLPASDAMYKHITRVMLQQHQVNLLNTEQYLVLSEAMQVVRSKLYLVSHHLKNEMIQNALVTFLLETSNIWIENRWDLFDEPYQIRYEYILKNFYDSLMQNYRREHWVSFYAGQLNITPQYLSLIVKSLTGRTPALFIFERLYIEARALLDCPALSIKEISEQLYFSDQSSFGKFFKKHSGLSPVDFRKGRQIRKNRVRS